MPATSSAAGKWGRGLRCELAGPVLLPDEPRHGRERRQNGGNIAGVARKLERRLGGRHLNAKGSGRHHTLPNHWMGACATLVANILLGELISQMKSPAQSPGQSFRRAANRESAAVAGGVRPMAPTHH